MNTLQSLIFIPSFVINFDMITNTRHCYCLTNLSRRCLLQERLPLCQNVHGIVDKVHVNVNGVNPRCAELNSDLLVHQLVSIESLQSRFGFVRGAELHQTPGLEDAILHGNLKKSWNKLLDKFYTIIWFRKAFYHDHRMLYVPLYYW